MKKSFKTYCLVAGMAALLVSCQKEKIADADAASQMIEYAVTADYDEETKTELYIDNELGYNYRWLASGEKLAVSEFSLRNGVTSVESQISNEGQLAPDGKMNFSVSFKSKTAEAYTYYAVYPSKAFLSAAISNGKITLNAELPEVQTPKADNFDPNADILLAKPIIGKPGENGFEFGFKRQSVGVKMKVRNFAKKYDVIFKDQGIKEVDFEDYADERIEKITIVSENSNISGKTSYIFDNGKIPGMTQKTYGTSNKVILDYTSIVDDEGNRGLAINNSKPEDAKNTEGNYIYFTTWPFVANDANKLFIEIQTTNYIFKKQISATDESPLEFNKSNIRLLNVGFSTGNVTVEHKDLPEALLKDTYYVVTRGDLAMIAEQNEKYLSSKKIGENEGNINLSNNNGVYEIADIEQLSAAWKFEYNDINGKYLISSVSDPDKYLRGGGDQSLTMVTKENATYFSVEQPADADYYVVIAGGRYLGCTSRFSMQYTETDNTKIKITKAHISSKIQVQNEFGIPVSGGKGFAIPVSLINVDENSVSVKIKDGVTWINNLAYDNGIISFDAEKGSEDVSRDAVITVTGNNISNPEEKVPAEVKVVQHHSVYYATILSSELKDAYKEGKWGTYDKEYPYTQPNGAEWGIACQESLGFMTMTVNSGYIKLPSFGEGRSIRRVTVKLNNVPYADRYIGLYPSADSNNAIATAYITAADKAAGKKEYVITVNDTEVKTAYIKTNTQLAISGIEVDARKPLPTPTGLETAPKTKTLSWNKVEGAVAYDVTVGTETATGVTTNSYEFKGNAEWYDVTVVAKADENSPIYIDSNPSTANLKFGDPKLNTPDPKEAGAKEHTLKVTWTADKRADGYVCTISPKGTITKDGVSVVDGVGVVEFEGLDGGSEYIITVQATSNGNYANSDVSSINVKTADITLIGDGSVSAPYTVADVNAFGENNKDLNLAGKYVEGKVTGTPVFDEDDKTMIYTITDDTTNEDGTLKTWEVTGKDLGNYPFDPEYPLKEGDNVIIYYSNNSTNYVYSIGGKTSILTGIEVDKKKTKLSYEYGETFVNPVVYASYRGAEKKEVTGTVTDQLESVTASQNLTVTYSEGGVDKSVPYKIDVVKFTHVTYAAKLPYTITTVTNGGVTSTWTNFIRYDSLKSLRGKAAVCSVEISAIPEEINTITFGIESQGINGTECALIIKENGSEEAIAPPVIFTFQKPTTTIDLGGKYKNCTYSIELDCTDFGNSKRLDISQIVFENK